jgi:hypothetical protein
LECGAGEVEYAHARMTTRDDPPLDFPVATLLWGVAGAIGCGSMIPLEPNMLEEGLILEIAQRLNHGDRLYQDVVAFTGPLPFEALAWLFRVFGEEIMVARTAVAVLHGGATAAVFALARSAQTKGLGHFAAALAACSPILLFPLFSTYFYTTLAVSIGLLASWAALSTLRDPRWAVVAGVLVACSTLCKQTVGAVLAAGLLVSLVGCAAPRARLRTALGLITGGLLVAVVTLTAFAFNGGLSALVYSMVELPLSFQPSYNSPFMNFWPLGRFSEEIRDSQAFYLPYFYTLVYGGWGLRPSWGITAITQLFYALPFIAVVATLLRRRTGPLPSAAWIHLATLLAMISNLFPRSDWGHLVSVLPSAAIQLVLVAPDSIGRLLERTRSTSKLLGFLALTTLGVAGSLYWISEEPSFGPRIPLRAVNPGYREQAVPHAIRYLREHTEVGDAIFVARAEPLIYFATDTRNPTPYGGVIPGMPEEQERVIAKALETTRYVVMTDIDQPVFTYYRDELPAVQEILERHYQIPDDFLRADSNWMLVLERGPDRGATHADLIKIASSGRPWVRVRDGSRRPARVFRETIGTLQNRRFLPLLLGVRGGGIDFDLDIPERAVFQASVGYPMIGTGSKRVYQHPKASRMELSIAVDGDFKTLAAKQVLVKDEAIRQWMPFDVDLSEFAGRSVTLRLELSPSRPVEHGELAWWGSPRIAIRPNPQDAR